jgi:hypothetical protein
MTVRSFARSGERRVNRCQEMHDECEPYAYLSRPPGAKVDLSDRPTRVRPFYKSRRDAADKLAQDVVTFSYS